MKRTGILTLVVGLASVTIASCSSTSGHTARSHVPREFRAACGHPGSHVQVKHVPVVVRHADCDLTGVVVSYRNYGGAVVSDADSVTLSTGMTVSVAPGTSDVRITAPRSGPGNA